MPRRDVRLDTQGLQARTALPVLLAFGLLLLVACGPRADAGVASTAGRAARPAGAPIAGSGARASPGCAAPRGSSPPRRLVVDGRERTVLARVPGTASARPRDLVIAFHGRTNDAAQVRRYLHLDEALPDAVIAYPSALPAGPGTFSWSDPGDPPERLRDFALVETIVASYGAALCLDLDRVFVVGHSLGASFANDVACRMGGRIRAVASVAGGLQGGACVGGSAALLIHHPDDRLVPLVTGERARDAFVVANALASLVAVPAGRPALAALNCVRYGRADAEDPVVWCPHDDATAPGGRTYPHTWPDAAAAAIAVFFTALP